MSDNGNIINIKDHMRPQGDKPVPCKVTFMGHLFHDAFGKPHSLCAFRIRRDGDFEKEINDVKMEGGVWLEGDRRHIFLPWPFAAVFFETVEDGGA